MTPYYEVSESAWIFRDQISQRRTEDKKWTNTEESVRQWCIHELIRSYSVRIDCIEIERHVKVARERKPNRIDIAVLMDGHPHVVVECKPRSDKNLDAAMKQACNYARLTEMPAAYAVATNGDQWLVQRYLNDQWLPVPELPNFNHSQETSEWRLILLSVTKLCPVQYWLARPVPAKQAESYLLALQEFFSAKNEITVGADRHLLQAADNLLRVLSNLQVQSGYLDGKMAECCAFMARYWKERGFGLENSGRDIRELAHDCYANLSSQMEDAPHDRSLNGLLSRVILAMLGYLDGMRCHKRYTYKDIPDNVQNAIRDYLNAALTVRFNATLPDPLDNMLNNDIRDLCKPFWESFAAKNPK